MGKAVLSDSFAQSELLEAVAQFARGKRITRKFSLNIIIKICSQHLFKFHDLPQILFFTRQEAFLQLLEKL